MQTPGSHTVIRSLSLSPQNTTKLGNKKSAKPGSHGLMVGDIVEGVANGTQTIVVDFPMLLATITNVPVRTSILSSFSLAGRSGAFPCTPKYSQPLLCQLA
jgi:hypothetical protein